MKSPQESWVFLHLPASSTPDQLKAWVHAQLGKQLTCERSVPSSKSKSLDSVELSLSNVWVESLTKLKLNAAIPLLGGMNSGKELPPIGKLTDGLLLQ